MSILSKNKFPLLIFLIAIFLRFYRIGPFTMFLSDQGRDAIIVKKIATLEHLTAIGPPTSLGHIFLGPFYYYLIAPFLLLARFDPVGMAVGVALLSCIGLAVCYFIVKNEFNKQAADIFLVLASFSFVIIEYSRFSWNPNLLPVFSFLTIYFFIKTLQTKKKLAAFIFGSLFALSLQLHYLSILLALPIMIITIGYVFKDKLRKKLLLPAVMTLAGFILFSSPLILFDLKHDYINAKNFIALFHKPDVIGNSSFLSRFQETNQSFINHTFQINLSAGQTYIIFIVLAILFLYSIKKKPSLFIIGHFITVIFYVFGFSLLTSFRYPHYYLAIYFSIFLLLSYVSYSILSSCKLFLAFVPILLTLFIFVNAKNYYFISREPNHQVKHARNVARFLAGKIQGKPFNIATWPIDFTEDTYLYFLELQGVRPANRELVEITDQMFVLCNTEPCSIINSPSWNISMFGKAKVANRWEIERVKVYKLIHEN